MARLSKSAVMHCVLELMVEDHFALWELMSQVMGTFPQASQSEARKAAETAVRQALKNEWVALFRRPVLAAPEQALTEPGEIESALTNNDFWKPPLADVEFVTAGATKRGAEAYFRSVHASVS